VPFAHQPLLRSLHACLRPGHRRRYAARQLRDGLTAERGGTLSQSLAATLAAEALLADAKSYAAEHGVAVVSSSGDAVSTIELGMPKWRAETPGHIRCRTASS